MSEAVEQPRQAHLAWDGLILHADNQWWETHYPPNGWGCQCYVETLSERDLEKLDKTPDAAPDKNIRETTIGRDSIRTVAVPEGIDPGFAYAPGRTAQLGHAVQHALRGTLTQRPETASKNIAKILDNVPAAAKALRKDWRDWVRRNQLKKD